MNNMIIDGNYLFFKTLFIFKAEKGKKVLEPERQQQAFIKKIATDLAFAIRQFGAPDRMIFTVDGSSWRKDIEIEENQGYKSHRKRGDEIDWDVFYRLMNEFAEIVNGINMISSKLDRAEGDDLMYLWAQTFLKMGENCIVITGDKDMHQLVRANGKNYCVIYNPNSIGRKVYGAVGLKEWLDSADEPNIFDTTTYVKTGKDLINTALGNMPLEELNPVDFLKKKILMGDDGDGVPSIFQWPSKNGKTVNRITAKRAESILEYIDSNYIGDWNVFHFPGMAEMVCAGIKHVTKQTPDAEIIKSKLERNITLMVLHKDTIPQEIIDQFMIHRKENIGKKLPGRKWDWNVILEGSKYDKPPEAFVSGLFGDLDKRK